MPVDVSVVVPVFNEGANIDALCRRLFPVLRTLDLTCEVVFVNDGSSDDTLQRVLAVAEREPSVRLIDLSRRFGKEAALSCGLAEASGRAVVTMDGDLQHPPEFLPEFVRWWKDGYEMVYGIRRDRSDQTTSSRLLARGYYWVFEQMSDIRLPRDAGDFRLLDRRVVDVLNALPERNRFMKGMFAWVGFRTKGVVFGAGDRAHGRSKWSLLRQLRFAVDGLTAFSNFPLRIWSVVGAVISLIAFAYIIFRLIRVAVYGVDLPGYESILAAVLFLGGVQLLSLGIIGDYLGRIFEEAKQRPLYIVRERYGTGPRAAARAPRELRRL
jgi:glycosyltransferase involved in cell wall biosynthesis